MEAYDFNKTARWTFFTTGAILVVLGVLSLLYPFVVLVTTAIFMGVGLLFCGLNHLVPYISMRNNPQRPVWMLPLAIVDIVVGVLFLSHIGLAIFTVTTLVGAWMLMTGGIRVFIAFKLKEAGAEKWWLMLASAILIMLVAGILLANPFVAGVAIALLTGASLIGMGVLVIMEGRTIYPTRSMGRKQQR